MQSQDANTSKLLTKVNNIEMQNSKLQNNMTKYYQNVFIMY